MKALTDHNMFLLSIGFVGFCLGMVVEMLRPK